MPFTYEKAYGTGCAASRRSDAAAPSGDVAWGHTHRGDPALGAGIGRLDLEDVVQARSTR
jgi:hypothetical protein